MPVLASLIKLAKMIIRMTKREREKKNPPDFLGGKKLFKAWIYVARFGWKECFIMIYKIKVLDILWMISYVQTRSLI